MNGYVVARRSALTLIAGSTILLGACKKKDPAAAAAAAAPQTITIGPENIAVVQTGQVTSGAAISGTLLPEREATIRAQASGSVLELHVDRGQAVSAGMLLARIDPTGLEDALLSARSAVTSAKNNADVAQREQDRAENLYKAGAIAEREVEQARRATVAATAALADARARLVSAERQLANTKVTAPFRGIVSERQVSQGDVVQPGGALFTIVDPSGMQLEASIPAEALNQVKIGTPVTFTVSGYTGKQFTGRVKRINPTADPGTRQVRLYISIPNAGNSLVGGLFATGRLSSTSRTGLLIPANAIDSRSSESAVIRVKGGKVERVSVALGLRDENTEMVEVTNGLALGDTVLLGAAQALTPGTLIRVTAVSDRPAK
jgi:membrane fusion protein, multidrug efflux system